MKHGTKWVAIIAIAAVSGLGAFQRVSAETATPESVAAAMDGQDTQASASIVAEALKGVLDSEMTEAEKRELVIAITGKAVVTAGAGAAEMMALVVKDVPSAWVPVIVATAVVSSGDQSSAVAVAMVGALEGTPEVQTSARAAAASPSSVLTPVEIRTVRSAAVQAQAPGVQQSEDAPVFIQPAEKYEGQ